VNSGTSNQSLRGMLLRTPLPEPVRTLLWLGLAAAVAYAGYRRIAAAGRAGDRLGATALTGLLAVLLSPVAWIHHLTWAVLALAAIVGDGRDSRRRLAAVAVAAYLTVPVPWWGAHLLVTDAAPRLVGRLVQDGFGLAALALLLTLPVARPRGGAAVTPVPSIDVPAAAAPRR
jgi:alpha-1,2-mannosyltransferase